MTTGAPPARGGAAVPTCSHCREVAVERIRYAGVHLCRDHLLDFTERRVKKELRKQGGIPSDATVGIAVSGGKDSIVALHLLARILKPRDDVRLVVLTVDEGITGYRENGIAVARLAAQQLELPHHIARYQDLVGLTMDDVHSVKGERNECSFCGVFRRSALNRLARDAGCDLLVTGHNLDDTAQAVLMNLTSGDPARLARLGPHDDPKDGLVPRRMPLRTIPEKEIYLSALLSGWDFDDHECPYAVNAQRGMYRDMLLKLEDAQPGTRHSLLKTLDALRPVLPLVATNAPAGRGIRRCSECSEPASGTVCQACTLGAEARERIAQRAATSPS